MLRHFLLCQLHEGQITSLLSLGTEDLAEDDRYDWWEVLGKYNG
jgi:hypothetical protein